MPKPSALLLLPLLLAASACTPEPYERPGTWQATGVNDRNLRAMVADPAHLTRGVDALAPARGEVAAMAADRLGRAASQGATVQPGSTGAQAGIPALPIPTGSGYGRR